MASFPTLTHYVLDESTLGSVYREQPDSFWPMAATVDGFSWLNGAVFLGPERMRTLRPATQADFDKFRVSSKGHLTP